MTRVLHLLDHSVPRHSGYSFRSRAIVTMQRRLGYDVAVVTSARHDEFSSAVEVLDGIRHYRTQKPAGAIDRLQLRIPFWRERLLTDAMAERLEQAAREHRPHVIHAHSPFFDGQAALRVGRKLGIPVVYEIRAFWEDDAVDKQKFAEGSFVYRQVRRLETQVVRAADHVVTICEGLRQDIAGRGIPADKITVIKNGADVDAFVPRARDEKLVARYGLEGKRVLGFIGSFFHYEGLPELVHAADRLRRKRDDFKMMLVGGGEDEAEVRALVAALGLERWVLLTGRVPHEDVQSHYSVIDAFVYPRRSRRLTELVTPLKPLEALAMEKIVLGTSVGGIRELWDECEVGALFAPGDPVAMDAALERALDRPAADLAVEGRRGREAVLTKRSWINTLSPIQDVYERLVGVPGVALAT
jgi:PEP-CTERM/exosortase A-associated glycosyltransferase